MRVIATFEKGPSVRFVGHLDTLRTLQRALRRSGLPVRYSVGFNPHMVLAFASALSVGVASTGEVMDIALAQDVTEEEFLLRLAPQMPPGFVLKHARAVPDGYAKLMNLVSEANYRVALSRARIKCIDLQAALAQPLMAEKRGKAGTKEVDLREWVQAIDTDEGQPSTLSMRLACRETGALNPRLLMPALLARLSIEDEYSVCRTGLTSGGKFLWEAGA